MQVSFYERLFSGNLSILGFSGQKGQFFRAS
jgi:hypothetical protein